MRAMNERSILLIGKLFKQRGLPGLIVNLEEQVRMTICLSLDRVLPYRQWVRLSNPWANREPEKYYFPIVGYSLFLTCARYFAMLIPEMPIAWYN
jgi:hypothetical protein